MGIAPEPRTYESARCLETLIISGWDRKGGGISSVRFNSRLVALPDMWMWADFHLSDNGVNQDQAHRRSLR